MTDNYILPDAYLLSESGPDYDFCVWQPSEKLAILGRGDKADTSLIIKNIAKDNIKVIQRPSGGHAVFLSEKMLAFSIVSRVVPLPKSNAFFYFANSIIIRALESLGVTGLSREGISDIAISKKKITGTAIYRNKGLVFFHAIINVEEKSTVFDRYLKYPEKAPEYRNSRRHSDFISSLKELNFVITIKQMIEMLNFIGNKSISSINVT